MSSNTSRFPFFFFYLIKSEMRSFKSNENIHKKEGGSYYVVSANKACLDLGAAPHPNSPVIPSIVCFFFFIVTEAYRMPNG